jgi:DNA-damage-inducible protein J
MTTSRISVNINEEIKQQAQRVFDEIGINTTTAIELFFRTVIREERIPFGLSTERAYREATHKEYIKAELEKSIQEAADPSTRRLTHEEVMANIAKRKEVRGCV